MVFEHFSPEARRAIVIAQEIAREQRLRGIRTECLLIALALEPGTEAGQLLAGERDALGETRADRQRRRARGWLPARRSPQHIPFTVGTKAVISDAVSRGDLVATSDLLLSLATSYGTSAQRWLREHGLDARTVLARVAAIERWESRDVSDEQFAQDGAAALVDDLEPEGED